MRQTSGAVFCEHQSMVADRVRTKLGRPRGPLSVRRDERHARQLRRGPRRPRQPEGGLVLGPWRSTELYVNAGTGFHSNDARGTTITVDPVSGEPADRVTPLVRARGAEVGVRTVAIRALQPPSGWTLGLDSELVFVGDAGTTEASRPSRRTGVECHRSITPAAVADARRRSRCHARAVHAMTIRRAIASRERWSA